MKLTFKYFLQLPICFLLVFGNFSPLIAQNPIKQRVFLIGDAGDLDEGQHLVMDKVKKLIDDQPKDLKTDYIFLGDNIYPRGMPEKGNDYEDVSCEILDAQLDIINYKEGRLWMIPGNHDWEQGKPGGFNAVLRQQAYLDSIANPNVQWLPRDGCPGPIDIKFNDNTILIVMDTQWWVHPFDKPEEFSDCEFKTRDEVMAGLEDIFLQNKDKLILFALHHPPRTFGEHNGAYTLKDHLFPLTAANKNLYIPLPLLGSIYPVYRTYFGSLQDQAHPLYKMLIERVNKIIEKHPQVITVSGHDHSLQYLQEDNAHFIVSGSGSRSTKLKKKNPLEFGATSKGFAILDFYENNAVSLSFFDLENSDPIFQKTLFEDINRPFYSPEGDDLEEVVSFPDSVSTPISYLYYVNKLQRRFLGENYRLEWQTSVPLSVFKINEEKGGFEIVKRGGGMQTKSLRLRNLKNEEEYVLRSVEKYPSLAIPSILRQTVAKDIVQDQISASNPFASLVIPTLANAVGVYHTDPKLVWLPDNPSLRLYREDFGANVFLFEKRYATPDDIKKKDFKTFSTDKMIQATLGDNDYVVNQREVLKARMLDLFIADWDRHDDQWTWIGIETKKGREFVPVPRDRDQAFFVNQGYLPKIASRNWIMPKLQGFDYDLRNVNGFMFNGRYFDRSFLNKLERADWEEILDEVSASLTDEVIEESVTNLPDAIYNIRAQEITSKLKYRRNWLKEKGLEYYEFLAKEVDVVGSEKDELFEITHFPSGNIAVQVSKISKKGETKQSLYDRTFYPEETEEIRLFGIGGEDVFLIGGNGPGKIKLRVIGSVKSDSIVDEAFLEKKSQIIYQWSKDDDFIQTGKNSKIISSQKSSIYDYNRKAFKYEVTSPLPSLEFNADDGLFLGAGIQWIKQGFRKEPYKTLHSLKGNVALRTGAFNFYYRGHFVDVIKNWDLEWKTDVRAPNYVNNFFGFGNESSGIDFENHDLDFYRVRYNMVNMGLYLRKEVGAFGNFKIGPILEYTRLDGEDNEGRFINNEELSGLNTFDINQRKLFSGIQSRFEINKKDNEKIPSRGIHFVADARHLEGLNEFSRRVTILNSSLSLYWTFREASRFTWATSFGGGYTFGDYEFFQAQNLSGKTNLRGFRRFRFAGDAMAYNNTELRIRFVNFKTYLFPASSGILLFHDVARVWFEGENSRRWHRSTGAGIWIAPLNRVVITGSMGFTREENLLAITFGFQF
ncbi:metallophosphoesterase [Aquiflexum sp.]|uniref:metallophosphoesterase n=1 Tax=Aquiflexum sp. TaxID=1872584 RepID=UPI003593FE5F